MEKKQLSDEELENVNGGCSTEGGGDGGQNTPYTNTDRSAYKSYCVEMSCDDCQVNEKYLFVNKDEPEKWVFGSVFNSYNRVGLGCFERMLDLVVMDGNGLTVTNGSGTYEICAWRYHTYRK